jgi:uncharacterized protein YbjT (DUF2867 family)
MQILVVGATGDLGSEIVKRLTDKGHTVRALVRASSAKRDALAKRGVEIALGDLRDRASIASAVAGVDAVVNTASSIKSDRKFAEVDRDGGLALVAEAKAAGVKAFVYVSISPAGKSDMPLVAAKRLVEAAVRESGMAWAVLQASMFMDIWLGSFFGWDAKKATAQVFGPGDAPIGYIAAADVAAFAVACLERPPNRALPLGGPRSLSQNEAVRVFERLTGKTFKVKRVPAFVFKAMRTLVGPFSDFFATLAGLTLLVINGDPIEGTATLAKEFGVELTSVESFVNAQMNRP